MEKEVNKLRITGVDTYMLKVRYVIRSIKLYFQNEVINSVLRFLPLLVFARQFISKNAMRFYYINFTEVGLVNFPQGLFHIWGYCVEGLHKERRERKFWEGIRSGSKSQQTSRDPVRSWVDASASKTRTDLIPINPGTRA